MTYMQSNLDLAGGIQELSLEEISFVSGGAVVDLDKFHAAGIFVITIELLLTGMPGLPKRLPGEPYPLKDEVR